MKHNIKHIWIDMQSSVDFVRTPGMKGICYKDFVKNNDK